MTRSVHVRLAIMMFLQFFIGGAFIPVLSLYLLRSLHFSGTQAGIIASLTSAGAIIAPIITVYIADRIIRSEWLLGLCHISGGILMLAFAQQKEFLPATLCFLAYTLITTPTFALTSAIVFHHSPDTRHRFGTIRVWGTIGWIAVAWLFSYLWLQDNGNGIAESRLPDALKIAAFTSFILGIFAFTLPAFHKSCERQTGFLPMKAFSVFKNPSVLRFCLFMLCITIADRYYYFGTAPFLSSIGFKDTSIMPAMSLGQIPEVFSMFILGWLLIKSGSKRVMLLGVGFDLFRFAACAIGGSPFLVMAGLFMHGLAYTFVFTTAAIYLDSFCDRLSRNGAHQFFSMITQGIGNFTGSLLVGFTLDWCTAASGAVNFRMFWLVPTASVFLLFIALLLFISSSGRVQKNVPIIDQVVDFSKKEG